jgi:hypothetical protein
VEAAESWKLAKVRLAGFLKILWIGRLPPLFRTAIPADRTRAGPQIAGTG